MKSYGDSKITNIYFTYELASRIDKSGEYFRPSGFMEMKGYPKNVKTNTLSKDKNIAKKLWDVSVKLTGVKFNLN